MKVINERIQYLDNQGSLITESLKDYTKTIVMEKYRSLDNFLRAWSTVEKKQNIIQELEEHGVLLYELQEAVGKDFDPFDLICHIVFGQPPLTRHERANHVKKRNYFTKYGEQARKVLESLLDKYATTDITNIENPNVLELDPIKNFGTKSQIIKMFGGVKPYKDALQELENEIYKAA